MSPRHTRMPFIPTRLAATALAVVLLAGCYPVQPRTATPEREDRTTVSAEGVAIREGGDLVMGLSAEPDQLDPTTSSSLYTRYVMSTICEKLYDIDAAGKIVPQLATALPEVSADGLTVTIGVRDGVQFADGTPFDADAVRDQPGAAPHAQGLRAHQRDGPIERASRRRRPDEVVIRYERPFAPITAALADRAGMIMSPTALADLATTSATTRSASGRSSSSTGSRRPRSPSRRDPLLLRRRTNVHLDTITYRIMSDANIRAANLRSGDIQVADTISPQDVDALAKERDVGLLQTGSLGYQGDHDQRRQHRRRRRTGEADRHPARQRSPRPAGVLARHRPAALVDTVFNNWYEPACSPIAPTDAVRAPGRDACPPYDPAKSSELLQEAGVEIPFPITVQISNTPDELRFAQALQASVERGRLRPARSCRSSTRRCSTQQTARRLRGAAARLVRPHRPGRQHLRASSTTGGGNNYGGYSSPTSTTCWPRAARPPTPRSAPRLRRGRWSRSRRTTRSSTSTAAAT